MKRVLFTMDVFETGGVSSFVDQYARVLVNNGYGVTIVAFQGNMPEPKKYFAGCKLIEIPLIFNVKYVERAASLFLYNYYLIKELLSSKYDLIHFSTAWSTFYALVNPVVWFIKKSITFYGAFDLEVASFSESRSKLFVLKKQFMKNLQYIGLLSASEIIVFSKYAKSLLVNHFSSRLGDKAVIIPGYVLTNLRKNKLPNFSIKKKFTVLNIGRAEPRKGIDLLLKSFKILSQKKQRDFQLIIASPAVYLQRFGILDKYEELDLFLGVRLVHMVNEEQIMKLFQMSNLFVIPSIDFETFGMTIIESMNNGLPVIGTKVGAIKEILEKVDKRLLCTKVDAKNLSEKINWYANLSARKRKQISQKGIKVVIDNYSYEIVAPKILHYFENFS